VTRNEKHSGEDIHMDILNLLVLRVNVGDIGLLESVLVGGVDVFGHEASTDGSSLEGWSDCVHYLYVLERLSLCLG
jgi:hypothetical protein